jgi:hypothetical protein
MDDFKYLTNSLHLFLIQSCEVIQRSEISNNKNKMLLQ